MGDVAEKTAGYVAVFGETVQTSEDSWEVLRRTKILTPETTVKEIMDWAKKNVEISIST
jgi:hypothetical protein